MLHPSLARQWQLHSVVSRVISRWFLPGLPAASLERGWLWIRPVALGPEPTRAPGSDRSGTPSAPGHAVERMVRQIPADELPSFSADAKLLFPIPAVRQMPPEPIGTRHWRGAPLVLPGLDSPGELGWRRDLGTAHSSA